MSLSAQTSPASARKGLTILWYAFFALDVAIILHLYLYKGWIEADNFKLALQHLNGLFAPYLGVILLFYWGAGRAEPAGSTAKAGGSFTLAFVGSLIWNLLILMFLLPLSFGSGTIEAAVENIDFAAGLLTWLVAGAIGFYFANPAASTQEPVPSRVA